MTGALVMAAVALACAGLSLVLFVKPVRSEAGTYRNRIAATMLAAAAIILVAYAYALYSWSR